MNASLVIKQLLADHEEFRRLGRAVESILRSPPAAQDPAQLLNLVSTFQRRLAEHAKLEDEEFYPAVRRAMSQSRLLTPAYMDHLDNEHRTIDRHLARLVEQVTPRPALGWGQTFAIFSVGLRGHLRREEEELFPEAARLMG